MRSPPLKMNKCKVYRKCNNDIFLTVQISPYILGNTLR